MVGIWYNALFVLQALGWAPVSYSGTFNMATCHWRTCINTPSISGRLIFLQLQLRTISVDSRSFPWLCRNITVYLYYQSQVPSRVHTYSPNLGGRGKEEGCEFKVSLGYRVRPCLIKTQQNEMKQATRYPPLRISWAGLA